MGVDRTFRTSTFPQMESLTRISNIMALEVLASFNFHSLIFYIITLS